MNQLNSVILKSFVNCYLNTWIVQRCVEHDDSEGEDVAGVRVGEDVRVQDAIALSKTFHHAIDFLGFAR
jgi:hypothetical protein